MALLGPLCGVSQPVEVTLSLTGFMLSAPWGMPGGLIYLLYRPSEHTNIREVERQVHDLEHDVAEPE